MARGIIRWTLRAGAIAALVGAAVKLASGRRHDDTAASPLFPPIGGDTWPPVPNNPRRG